MKALLFSRSWHSLRFRPSRRTSYFYSLIFCVYFFVALMPVSVSFQEIIMRKFHLSLKPFGLWAAAQVIPSMYNFHNEIFLSYQPLDIELNLLKTAKVQRLVLNHYPLRALYFLTNRNKLVHPVPINIVIRSTYRSNQLITSAKLFNDQSHIVIHIFQSHAKSISE